MSTHIEWADAADTRVIPITAKDIEELADGGNEDGDIGLSIETDQATIVYGTIDELTDFALQVGDAVLNLKRRYGKAAS